MKEKAVLFGKHQSLVGIVTEPEAVAEANRHPAILLLNAGLIHRVGPNRIYVKLARHLARAGYLVLRLDLSGIGDSQPRPDNLPADKSLVDDVQQGMAYLALAFGCQRFVLMGHCAGAFIAFYTATLDTRVSGVVLMNPEGNEPEWTEYDRRRKLATHYQNVYAQQKLRDPQSWKRLFTGQVSYQNILRIILKDILWFRLTNAVFKLHIRLAPRPAVTSLQAATTIEGILHNMSEAAASVLLIYYSGSTHLERAPTQAGRQIEKLIAEGKLTLQVIPQSDHLFTLVESQQNLSQVISAWLTDRETAP